MICLSNIMIVKYVGTLLTIVAHVPYGISVIKNGVLL